MNFLSQWEHLNVRLFMTRVFILYDKGFHSGGYVALLRDFFSSFFIFKRSCLWKFQYPTAFTVVIRRCRRTVAILLLLLLLLRRSKVTSVYF